MNLLPLAIFFAALSLGTRRRGREGKEGRGEGGGEKLGRLQKDCESPLSRPSPTLLPSLIGFTLPLDHLERRAAIDSNSTTTTTPIPTSTTVCYGV